MKPKSEISSVGLVFVLYNKITGLSEENNTLLQQ